MNVVVTGAAGFIGGHVTDRLLAQGHAVLALDNLSFGRREYVAQGAEFWLVDLGEVTDAAFKERIVSFGPDCVVHLASIHFIPYCISHPERTFLSNVRSTDLIARTVAQCRSVRKILAASTMDVYPPSDVPHKETDAPSPRNVYGLSKLLTEHIIRFAVETTDQLAGVCLRLSNVYGPRETNPHLIPDALQRITSHGDPEIRMGYLGGTRDFIHVFDVVDALFSCLFQDTGRFQLFNVGTRRPTAVRQVVEILRDELGDSRPIVEDRSELRTFDRMSLTPDISRATTQTDWRPTTTIEEGLRSLARGIDLRSRE